MQKSSNFSTNTRNSNNNKKEPGGNLMADPGDYTFSINSDGNYEAVRYNPIHKFTVTLEFLGTEDSEQISSNFIEILKSNVIGRIKGG